MLGFLCSYELSRWERGTLPFETIAGQHAAIDYIASLGGVSTEQEGRRAALEAGFAAIELHENALCQRLEPTLKEATQSCWMAMLSGDSSVGGLHVVCER